MLPKCTRASQPQRLCISAHSHRQWGHALYAYADKVERGQNEVYMQCSQVCEHIVIPNIRLRDDMEEMFEMNWVEYVRRDTEGSDNDTRRRAATDLVKALTARFEAQVRT